jgi:peptide/nickel transport system substrate-binding protein
VNRLYHPRWPLLLALVIGVGALVALAYVPSRDSSDALPERGGSYVEGVAGAPSIINPLYAGFNDVDQDLSALVFAGLVQLGPNGAVEPDMAELPTITPDGLTYVFEMKPGLVWHDGAALTTEDVLFTIDMMQHPNFEGDPVLADLFRGVQAVAADERTIIVSLPEPFSPFLARGATVGILPKHLLEGVTPSELPTIAFNKQPIGSGPFRLTGLTGAAAVLQPFDAYHAGRPFLERLELRFYRDDGELLSALRNDEVAGALFRPGGLDSEEVAFVDGDAASARRILHPTTYGIVYLNNGNELFQSPDVRSALQHALDVPTLIENVLSGQAIPMDSPIASDLWAYIGSPGAYAFEPDLALERLRDEGWDRVDGVLERDGEPFAFSLAASDDPVQQQVAQEIARQWTEFGAQVTVQVSGASQFVEGVLLPRQFEAALVSVDPGPDPDPYPFWHSSQTLNEGRNLAGYSDAEVDELLENGRLASSPAQRAEDYRTFQEIFAEDAPSVLLYLPTYQYVVDADLQGVSPGLLLTLASRFEDIHQWFVEPGAETSGVDEDGDTP